MYEKPQHTDRTLKKIWGFYFLQYLTYTNRSRNSLKQICEHRICYTECSCDCIGCVAFRYTYILAMSSASAPMSGSSGTGEPADVIWFSRHVAFYITEKSNISIRARQSASAHGNSDQCSEACQKFDTKFAPSTLL